VRTNKRKKDKRHRRRDMPSAKATPRHIARIAIKERPKVEPAPEITEAKRWHVARMAVRNPLRRDGEGRPGELQLEKELNDAGFLTYRPVFREKVVRQRARLDAPGRPKVVEAVRDLFPGYLLIAFDPRERDARGDPKWTAILGFDGIHSLLRSRTTFEPIAIPIAIVRDLAESAERALPDPKVVRAGESVRITGGAFATFGAIVQELLGDDRVRLEVSMFGRRTPVDTDLRNIQAA
jgi:transcription antitermination factor NusG